jgi:hypothetical protein
VNGYKGFGNDFKCRGFQFEPGKTYEHDGEARACASGFHFCESPFDVWTYYPPSDSRFAKVEGMGKTDKNGEDSKVACTKLHVGAEISLNAFVNAGVKFILDRVTPEKKETNTGNHSAATNTGYRSAATNTGNQSASTNTGYQSASTNTGTQSAATNTGNQSASTNTGTQSAATNTGTRSAATNTGNWSAATNTGDRSAATNTGDQSAATNTGNWSAATNTGNQSAATNTGNWSAATNTGYRSAATNTGYRSAATNTGYRSAATVEGREAIAMATGIEGKAKGKKSCWLVLAEWEERKDGWHIKDVKSVAVDGKKIKEDTFYTLKGGKFVEVK